MGTYYDAEKVKANGLRMTYASPDKRQYLRFKYRLVAVQSNGLREIAADVTDPDEHEAQYAVYACGGRLSFDLYDYNPEA